MSRTQMVDAAVQPRVASRSLLVSHGLGNVHITCTHCPALALVVANDELDISLIPLIKKSFFPGELGLF